MLTAVSLVPSVLRAVQVSSRLAIGALAVATVLMFPLAAPASAHTDLDSTMPSDGASVDEPVEEVTLTFTLPVTQLGEGLSLQGPDGAVPAEVSSRRDGLVWVAVPQQPLVAGAYAGEWTVAAKDGHPLSGEFSFTVEAESADEQTSTADDGEATTQASADAGAGSSSGSGTTSTTSSGENDGAYGAVTVLARLASAAALWGGLVAAGGLVFAAWVLTGRDRDDRPVILRVVRWSAALILLAVAIRIMARAVLLSQGDLAAALSAEAISTSLGGTTRWVLGLQAAGALLVVVGARRAASVVWVAAVGVLAIGAGHVLAGHSNTVEPRWIVLLADVAHLLAAAVWVGGLVMLGVLLRHRRRRGGRPARDGATPRGRARRHRTPPCGRTLRERVGSG